MTRYSVHRRIQPDGTYRYRVYLDDYYLETVGSTLEAAAFIAQHMDREMRVEEIGA